MARRNAKRFGADDITAVWTAPEQLRATRVQKAVDDGASAQEVADLVTQTAAGEFRESLGDEEIEGKIHPKLGDLLVWVHPVDADSGWYERYSGDEADYQPVQRPGADDDDGGEA